MFETVSELGEGVFGDVFLVQNKMTGEKFALKILNKDFMIKTERVRNVYQEKQILLKAGKHPHIAALRGSF